MLQWAAVHGFMELIVKNWQSVTVATLFRSTTKGSATVGKTGLETGATVPKKITRLVLEMERYAGTDNVHVKTVTPELEQVAEVSTVSTFLQGIENYKCNKYIIKRVICVIFFFNGFIFFN